MSKIWDMLKKEKVKWKMLGEVCEINKYKQIDAKKLESLNLGYGEITLLPSSKNYNWKTTEKIAKDLVCCGKVITLGRARYSNIKYCDGKFISSNNIIVNSRNENVLSPKFLYHFIYLNNEKFYVETGSYPKFENTNFKNFKIPIPSLETQEKIVDILDRFTECTTNLCSELNKELELRIQQYEYYRDMLLSEEYLHTHYNLIIKHEKLNSCLLPVKKINWDDFHNSKFRYIDLSSVNRDTCNIDNTELINRDNAPSRAQQIIYKDDILFGTTRPLLKRYCIIPKEYDTQICSTGFSVLRANKKLILPKWIFYTISTNSFLEYVKKNERGASYPAITDEAVKSYKILLPPIEIQNEIINILDKFHTIVHDLKIGLPREIELRQKQYEYYRDKLLSFDSCEC